MLPDTFSHAWLDFYYLSLDFLRFLGSLLQSRVALATENLFLRKQPALYQERQLRPRRATDATRLTMGCFPSSIVGRIGVKIWVTIGYSQISPHQF
jgi:hypothetical protein